MRYVIRVFISGLLVVIPILITIYICYWLFSTFELLFKKIFSHLAPFGYFEQLYFPGMGTIGGIILIFIIGFLMQNWGFIKLYEYGETVLEKFPIIGDIYSTLKSLLQYFASSDKEKDEQVVVIEYKETRMLGIVTRENFDNTPSGIGGKNIIAVYLPMSYQLGGYTIYIDKKYVTKINMSKKEALQWILTAGLGSN